MSIHSKGIEMIGQTISHYKILEKLGEGGMGVVYKAHDTKLERTVALKFLPSKHVIDEADRTRFLQEARAASALSHPNVCHINAIEEADGKQFIDMEYIEGITLREKIKGSRDVATRLRLDDVLSYAVQIGEALEAAHAKDIVHRDVKSENIMVTAEGRIKVMDFGLAKLKGSLKLTRTSSTAGTLAYMAPEQIQGIEIDARSDIFSFGTVVYEMLTGKFPFRGEHEAAMMYSILNEDPIPVTTYRSDLSPAVAHILKRALQKDPSQRYQSVTEMLIDLKQLGGGSQSIERKQDKLHPSILFRPKTLVAGGIILVGLILLFLLLRDSTEHAIPDGRDASRGGQIKHKLAILPFQNLGDDEKMNFLGFALADNIITNLSYLHSIVVRPSSAVARYRSEVASNEQIAQQLDVNVILTGNYLREGDDLHLTAQLVDLTGNTIIWQKPIDVQYKGIMSVQQQITQEIIRGLQLSLTSSEQARVHENVPRDPIAYEIYLRGKALSGTSDLQSLNRSIVFFDQVIEREPGFAPAYADKGFALIYAGIFGGDTSNYRSAEVVLHQALAIDSTLPDALSRLGFLYIQTAQKERAFPLLQRAATIAPNISDIHNNIAYFYRLCGLLEESYEEASLALQLNPGDRRAYAYKMFVEFMRGRYDEAIAIGEEGLMHIPLDLQLLVLEAIANYFAGDIDGLSHYAKLSMDVDPRSAVAHAMNALVLAVKGDRTQTLPILARVREAVKADMEQSFILAMIYAELGLPRETTEWLMIAHERGLDAYPWIMRIRAFDKVQMDSGFQKVVLEIKQRHEAWKAKYGKKL